MTSASAASELRLSRVLADVNLGDMVVLTANRLYPVPLSSVDIICRYPITMNGGAFLASQVMQVFSHQDDHDVVTHLCMFVVYVTNKGARTVSCIFNHSHSNLIAGSGT